jgi:hypothetical protein
VATTRITNFVIDDNAVDVYKLNVVPGYAGQVLSIDGSNNLVFVDRMVTEEVEDIVADLIAAGTHTNITITYDDVANSLSFNASGAVTSVNSQTGAVSLTTTNIPEGTNLYYTTARFDSALATKTTNDLTEGLNLYFTQARARSSISVNDLGGDGSLVYNSATGAINYTGPSATEVRAHFSAGTGVSISNGQISIAQSVATTANPTFNDITATGNVVISGNLTVDGTTTTINATELAIEDNMIYLNVGSTVTNPDLGWVGNYNDGTYAHTGVFRDATDGVFKFFDGYTPEPGQSINVGDASFNFASVAVDNVTAAGYVDATYFTGDGANLTSVLTNYSTTDLAEGSNLYFTDERAQDAVASALVAGTNTSIVYDDVANTITISVSATGGIDLSNNTTDDLSEGTTNLYFTNERVDDRVASLLVAGTNISLVYDDTFNTLTIAANGLTGNTTDDLVEGTTNLYFTDERAQDAVASALVGGSNITITYDDVANTITIDGIEDDLSNNTTDDLNEGTTNLYWTSARGDANFATNLALSTTSDLTEGTNLYYTDARARASISVVDTSPYGVVSYDNVTGVVTVSGPTLTQVRASISGGTGVIYDQVSGVISIGQDVSTTENVTFHDIQANGSVTIQGDLTVSGTTTTVNTQEILLADNIITLNSDLDALTAPTENAGFEINRGSSPKVDIRWNETSDKWEFTNDGSFYVELGTAGVFTGDTDGVNEGTTNLYFTDERAQDAVASALVAGSNITITYDDVANTITIDGIEDDLSNNTTDDLNEGTTNLYYTDERVDDRVAALIQGGTAITVTYDDVNGTLTIDGIEDDLSNNTTDNLSEGTTNLYYTDTRADARVDVLRTELSGDGTGAVHFNNLTNVPTVTFDKIVGTGASQYTLSSAPGSSAAIIVTIDGVTQLPTDDYTVSGTTLYFTTSLPAGHTALVRHVGYQISGGTITTATNAELLDGIDSTQFLRSDTDDTMVGNLTMTGNIIPSANVTYNLGSSTNRWNELWLSTTTVNIGDNALSADVNNNMLWNSTQVILADVNTDIVPVSDNTYSIGSATNQFATIYGHTVEATYADLAERYASDAPYEPGTVVVFGGEAEITTTTTDLDVAVAGVISTNPALKLNSQAGNSQTHPYVALRGRVPCKVVGPVRKGDLLVTSTVAGYAKSVGKIDMGRSVFAKSITEDLTDGMKIIEVVII